MLDVFEPKEILRSVMTLDTVIMNIDREEDLQTLIAHEKSNHCRFTVLMRLYHRFSKLRREREHKELHKLCQN